MSRTLSAIICTFLSLCLLAACGEDPERNKPSPAPAVRAEPMIQPEPAPRHEPEPDRSARTIALDFHSGNLVGSLIVAPDEHGMTHGELTVINQDSGNFCGLIGVAFQEDNRFTLQEDDCTVVFEIRQDTVILKSRGCHAFCGMSARFDGTYELVR